MSKKNYTNYNNMSNNPEPVVEKSFMNEPIEEVEEVTEAVATTDPIEAPEVVEEPEVKTVYGYVDKCEKLNIRKRPSKNAEVVCVAPAKSEVMIDTDKSTNDWFSVRTAAGIDGFCMKNFITIK